MMYCLLRLLLFKQQNTLRYKLHGSSVQLYLSWTSVLASMQGTIISKSTSPWVRQGKENDQITNLWWRQFHCMYGLGRCTSKQCMYNTRKQRILGMLHNTCTCAYVSCNAPSKLDDNSISQLQTQPKQHETVRNANTDKAWKALAWDILPEYCSTENAEERVAGPA